MAISHQQSAVSISLSKGHLFYKASVLNDVY